MDNADSLAASALLASVITQGFGFCYGQLQEVLQRHRDGRLGEPIGIDKSCVPEVARHLSTPLVANADIVETRLAELIGLAERLGRHVGVELDPADPDVRADVAELIDALEAVFGQRLATGPTRGVHAKQEAEDIYGPTTALRVGRVSAEALARVEQKIGTVHPGGEATAVHLDYLG